MPDIVIQERRICWPTFDCTCLEGGCGYCNDNRFRSLNTIEEAIDAGQAAPYHRGTGDKEYDPWAEYSRGKRRDFNNAETRTRTVHRT